MIAYGDLFFLHGLQQGALDLGRGAIDFIGEDKIGKYRAALDPELSGTGIKNFRAHNVCGQHIRSELDAVELGIDQGGERL